jgi:nicotinate-nucleotide pyrophosphorylase (carboxylating)
MTAKGQFTSEKESIIILDKFIKNALEEDVREGDHSSLACIPLKAIGKAQLLVKEDGILAGMELAAYIYHKVDPEILFVDFKKDGEGVKKGEIAFTVEGKIQTILMLERLVLNCMQRMSGIATKTHSMVARIVDMPTKLIDTRKTTPGFRFFEKWAVRIGGGHNHRFGLYDMIMLKDNHVDGAGGIKKAIEATHAYLKRQDIDLKVEIETRNIHEVKQVLAIGGVDRIMLDNFDIPALKEAIELIDHKFETEASGGINEENIRDYAMTGVDYISSSIMTHSVKSIDLSLKLVQ